MHVEQIQKFANKKSAEAIVDAAILVNWVNSGTEISTQMRKKWIRLVTSYPEISASLFQYGNTMLNKGKLPKGSKY